MYAEKDELTRYIRKKIKEKKYAQAVRTHDGIGNRMLYYLE
jgi:hypothetical protein